MTLTQIFELAGLHAVIDENGELCNFEAYYWQS